MAAARETTLSNIKPLNGSIVRRYTAGSAIVPGEAVCMSADGAIDPADGSNVATTWPLGVALTGLNRAAAFAAGDLVDVVVFGPVQVLTGATPGTLIYVSDDAGEYGESVGTKDAIIGFAESATVLFVRPQLIDLS